MIDIKLAFGDRQADLASLGYDLDTDDSIQTAIIVSLFTDREADATDELPAGETDRRGWCLDSTLTDGDKIGSKLWLLQREKQTEHTRRRAEQYCREALQWLLDDGLVGSLEVVAEWSAPGLLGILVRYDEEETTFNTALEG